MILLSRLARWARNCCGVVFLSDFYFKLHGCGFIWASFAVLLDGLFSLATLFLPHRFVGPSLLAPHGCSGLCFWRNLWIARTITGGFAALDNVEGWMFVNDGRISRWVASGSL